MSAAGTLLLDTNVWIDLYDGGRPSHAESAALVERALGLGFELMYAVSSVKDVYHAIAMASKRRIRGELGSVTEADTRAAEAAAWGCSENMGEIGTSVGIDASDVWLAGKYRAQLHDFEDALIVAAAVRCHAEYLITGDGSFLQHCPVPAMDVRGALAYFDERDALRA